MPDQPDSRRPGGPFLYSHRDAIAPDGAELWAGLRIGLLGGSFNPPHEGHREISLTALARLQLDLVIWLVTPGNPLKAAGDYAPLAQRLEAARAMARHPRLLVSDLETRLGTAYTAETLAALRRAYPRTRFVWLMGSDNLASFHRWRHWQDIAAMVPIAVFNRPGDGLAPLFAPAARRFAGARLPEEAASTLAGHQPPAWVFLPQTRNSASSTTLRARST